MRDAPTTPSDAGPGSRAPAAHSALPRRGLLGGAGLALGATLAPPGASPTATAAAQPIAPAAGQAIATGPPARPMDGALHRRALERALEVREACARTTD